MCFCGGFYYSRLALAVLTFRPFSDTSCLCFCLSFRRQSRGQSGSQLVSSEAGDARGKVSDKIQQLLNTLKVSLFRTFHGSEGGGERRTALLPNDTLVYLRMSLGAYFVRDGKKRDKLSPLDVNRLAIN